MTLDKDDKVDDKVNDKDNDKLNKTKFGTEYKKEQRKKWVLDHSYDVVCQCGKKIKRYYLSQHKKSKYHKTNMKQMNNDIYNRIDDLEESFKDLELKLLNWIKKPII